MPSHTRIRLMKPQDCEAAAKIVAQNPLWERYRFGHQAALETFQNALPLEENQIFVAETQAQEIVGFAWVQPRGGFGRAGYLRLLGVSPTQQGQGIGEALLRAAEQASHGQTLLLLVSSFNEKGIRFYQRQGYVQAGALATFVLPDVDELLFWKKPTTKPPSTRSSR